jgi:hypothetical protein
MNIHSRPLYPHFAPLSTTPFKEFSTCAKNPAGLSRISKKDFIYIAKSQPITSIFEGILENHVVFSSVSSLGWT